jgi:LmbE family N-acetylglucosaminyl deacetylase
VSLQETNHILVIVAHPDDEVFVSGTLCLCSSRGFNVILACATDGGAGSRELIGRFEAIDSNLDLGAIRRREVALSAWVLGASEVLFLNEPDIPPTGWQTQSWDSERLVKCLKQLIRSYQPTMILTHGPRGGYGHPAHRALHDCVMTAARKVSFGGSIFSFCGQVRGAFFSWRFDDLSDVLIDVRRFRRRREASLSYHQSANEFFLAPSFPNTLRQCLSALFGLICFFTPFGRQRIPIVTPARFFKRFPIEGLALQQAPGGGPHFFRQHFATAREVRLTTKRIIHYDGEGCPPKEMT